MCCLIYRVCREDDGEVSDATVDRASAAINFFRRVIREQEKGVDGACVQKHRATVLVCVETGMHALACCARECAHVDGMCCDREERPRSPRKDGDGEPTLQTRGAV